jgi:hypothetical protein
MKNSKLLAVCFFAVGFFGGGVLGCGFTFLKAAPSVTGFLTAPLEWGLRNTQESLDNPSVVFPAMFIYWGCIGVLFCFLVRYVSRTVTLCWNLKGRDVTEEKSPPQQ